MSQFNDLKLDSQLRTALNIPKELMEKSNIKTGYNKEENLWEVIVKYNGDIQNNPYAMQQPIWDVNFIYTRNYIRGGYYFFRLFFNKDGIVENQKVLFASDGFLWL